jgi:hypothetical protein
MPGQILDPKYIDPEILGKAQLKTIKNYAEWTNRIASARVATFSQDIMDGIDDDAPETYLEEKGIAFDYWQGIQNLSYVLCEEIKRSLNPEREY